MKSQRNWQFIFFILFLILSVQPIHIYPQADPGTDEIDDEPELVVKQPKTDGEVSINLPVLGDVLLTSKGGNLVASIPGSKLDLAPIPLKADSLEVKMESGKDPVISGAVTFFGKKATLSSTVQKKEGKQISSINFNLAFSEPLSLLAIPNKPVSIKEINIILSKDKKTDPVVSSKFKFLGQNIDASLAFSPSKTTLNFSLPETNLTDLVPNLDKRFKAVTLKSLSFSTDFKNSKSDTQEGLQTKLDGTADFSSLSTSGTNINLEKLAVTATSSKDQGFHLEASIKNLSLPVIGKIDDIKFLFDSAKAVEAKKAKELAAEKKDEKTETKAKEQDSKEQGSKAEAAPKNSKASVSLVGNGSFSIPKIGDISFELDANYSDQGFQLTGKVNKPITYAGIEMPAVSLKINPAKKSITLISDITVKGFDLNANLAVDAEKNITFSGTTSKKTWKPFKSIESDSVPNEIKDITINDLKVNLKKEDTALGLTVSGNTSILGQNVSCDVQFIKNNKEKGVILKAGTDDLPGEFKSFGIVDAYFVVTTMKYIDPKDNIAYFPGLSLTGQISLGAGKLKTIGQLINAEDQKFTISGNLKINNLKNSKLDIKLSEGIPTDSSLYSVGPVTLRITGEPKLALVLVVTVKPPKNDEDLIFRGSAGITTGAIEFDIGMDGMWKNPFGISGFSIGNLFLSLGINPAAFPPPTEFAMTGEMDLTDDKSKVVKFAVSVNVQNIQEMALLGELDGSLSLLDIINLFASKLGGAKIPQEGIPELSIKDVKVQFAPKTVQIGEVQVKQGIVVKGEFDFLGEKVKVDFEISKTGIVAKASMTPINFLNVLKVTAGETVEGKTRETELGGPAVDIELTSSKQVFMITGAIDIINIFKSSADILISSSGIEFKFDTKIAGGAFECKVIGKSAGKITNPDFTLTVSMEQTFTDYLLKKVIPALKKAKEELSKKVEEAKETVDESMKNAKKDASKALNDAKQELQDAKDSLKAINDKMKDAQSKIDSAQDKVDSIQGEISDTLKEISSLSSSFGGGSLSSNHPNMNVASAVISGGGLFEGIGEGFKKAADWTKGAAEDAADWTKGAAEDAAEGLEKGAKAVANAGKIAALSTKVAGLKTALETAKVALAAAKGLVTGSMIAAQKTAEAAVETAKAGVTAADETQKVAVTAANKATQGAISVGGKVGEAAIEAAQKILKGLLEGFMIEKVEFKGSLKELENGKMPKFSITMKVLGKTETFDLQIDFEDIGKSAKDIAEKVISKLGIDL